MTTETNSLPAVGSLALFGDFPTQRTTSDCFSACLAWLLRLSQDEMPDFTDKDDARSGRFYHNVSDFLRPRGLRMMLVEWRDMPPMLGGPVIARGISPREKAHAVIWSDDGLLHDPHPSRAGLIGEPTHAMLILVSPNDERHRRGRHSNTKINMETTQNPNTERGDVRSIDCSADSGNHPCPFCNCDETYVAKSGALACPNCQARGPWDHRAFGDPQKDEVEMWNLRMAHAEELRIRDAKISDLERKLHKAEQTIDQLNGRIIEEGI